MNRLRLAILASILLSMASAAHATTVAILRPTGGAADLIETVARLKGELASVGLGVVIADRPADLGEDGRQTRRWIESTTSLREVDALIEVRGGPAQIAVDVWVQRLSPRRYEALPVWVDRQGGNIPEKLAIRAIEVLRSCLLEMDLASRKREGEPEPASVDLPAPREDSPPAPSQRPGFGLELGSVLLVGTDGIGPALMPLLRADWSVGPNLVVQAQVAGFGSRPSLSKAEASARVAQQVGLFGGTYRLGDGDTFWPTLVFAAGAMRTTVDGQAALPRQGHLVEQWSLVVDAGVGAGVRITPRYFLSFEARAQVAAPYVAVHFADTQVATSGRPNLLFTLTLGAWL